MASEDRHPVPDPEADPSDPGCELVAEAPPPREIDPTTHYDLSLRIDEMFGPPRLPCGDDLLEYRRIEDSMAERWFKNDDPRIQFDIRCWCMALFEARRYERLRQDLLVEQMALEIVIALPSDDKPEFKGLKEDIAEREPAFVKRLERKLARAGSSLAVCQAAAMQKIAEQYEHLGKLIDAQEKKARDIEKYVTRRRIDTDRMYMIRYQAEKMGARNGVME